MFSFFRKTARKSGMYDWRSAFSGTQTKTPLLNGSSRVAVNFDSAATTPPFIEVAETVTRFMDWYSSIHRGMGYKSLVSTEVYEQSREVVERFCGADPRHHTAIFCSNSTHAINILAHRLKFSTGRGVLATHMEHHSNLLPWKNVNGKVEYADVLKTDGSLDLETLEAKLKTGKVGLVAVTGASNVTGVLNPLGVIARLAHAHGALLMVDAAQLIAHRAIDMKSPSDPEAIDFLTFSAHKVYAPYGSGVLIVRRDLWDNDAPPAFPGGGTVRMVTDEEVLWADLPDKEEGGTPNVVGALALAKSFCILQSIGMDKVEAHEATLTHYLLACLNEIPEVRIYGPSARATSDSRLGVVSFTLKGYHHGLLASILGFEYGIAVRNGCFCAQPYLMRLQGLSDQQVQEHLANVRKGDMRNLPGFVRISLALYSVEEEVDYFCESLKKIIKKGPRGHYRQNETGQFIPENFRPPSISDFLP
ncbi:TPA: aminotransferase [Candidatus Sumerlaeota bacterium]|nr:aminotransferase [Candidatus Sumerlaeota bacterium]